MPWGMFNHPLLFAAVAVVALGVVIYEIVSNQEKPHGRGGRPPGGGPDRRPPPGNSPRGGPGRPPQDNSLKSPGPPDNSLKPPTDSSKNTNSPSNGCEISDKLTVVKQSAAPGNNLRKRNVNQTSNERNSLSDSRNAGKDTATTAAKKTSEISSSSSSQCSPDKKFDEVNYSRNMLDKLTSDAKNINENIKNEKCLGHNICEDDSDSPESNLIAKDEVKLINQTNEKIVSHSKKQPKRKKKSKCVGLKSAKNNNNSDQHQIASSSDFDSNSDDSVTFAPTKDTKVNPTEQRHHANKIKKSQGSKSQSSNFHPSSNSGSDIDKSSSCSDEDTYKRELYESLKNEVYGIKEDHVNSSTVSSPERIKEEKTTDSKICKACEEKRVNTCAYPCNHSYLCVDCAVRIFRIYQKCAICHARVEEFLQVAS